MDRRRNHKGTACSVATFTARSSSVRYLETERRPITSGALRRGRKRYEAGGRRRILLHRARNNYIKGTMKEERGDTGGKKCKREDLGIFVTLTVDNPDKLLCQCIDECNFLNIF